MHIKLLLLCGIMAANTGFAAAKNNDVNKDDDYGSNAYTERSSGIAMSLRLGYSIIKDTQTNIPAAPASVTNPPQIESIFSKYFMFSGSSSIFLFENLICVEASGEILTMSFNADQAQNAIAHFGGSYTDKLQTMYAVRMPVVAKIHPAELGAIKPYLGGGWHGIYFFSKDFPFDLAWKHGPVVEFGTNITLRDGTTFTLGARQFWLTTDLTYKKSKIGAENDIKTKLKLNPFEAFAGIIWKF